MQVDAETKNALIDECNDELMKTTISSEEKEQEGTTLTHAQRIHKLHY